VSEMVSTQMEFESLRIMKQCPRFARCSVPICPLDLQQDLRYKMRGEPRCTLSKSKRQKIGAGTALERQGLTKSEWAGRQSWDGLSEVDKRIRTDHLRPFRANCSRDSERSISESIPELTLPRFSGHIEKIEFTSIWRCVYVEEASSV